MIDLPNDWPTLIGGIIVFLLLAYAVIQGIFWTVERLSRRATLEPPTQTERLRRIEKSGVRREPWNR